MAEEVWKPVDGYEGLYEVSNIGNVLIGINILKKMKTTIQKRFWIVI